MNRLNTRIAAVLGTAFFIGGCAHTSSSRGAPPDRDDQSPSQRPDQPPPPPDRHGGPGAQGHRPPGPPDMKRMMDDLNLTDSQKEQVKPIMEAFHKKQHQAREEMLAEMKKVLKSDQYEKLEKGMRPPPRDGEDRNGEDRHGPGHHEKGGPPDRQ